jgi:copper oxidase (laccase) domain-containing protein
MFDIKEDALTLPKKFPALAGITNRWASETGDFGYGDFSAPSMSEEYKASRILARAIGGVCNHGKIIPEHGDKIVFSDKCHGYHRADGLIEFNPEPKKMAVTLFSITADCPTVVFASADQNLIGIVHSGWKGCHLNIAQKAVELIWHKTKIDPKTIYVGIFPGICGKCFNVNDDVGKIFPSFYKNGRINLTKIILDQLFLSGIIPDNISISPYCSYCTHTKGAYPFFSYRRDETRQRNTVFISRKQ